MDLAHACTRNTIIKVRCHAATHSLHTTYQRPCLVVVRSGTTELFIDIECPRAMDSSWMYLIFFVTIRIGIELAAVQMKLPDCVVVGLQLYWARTFYVTLSPRIYKGGQGPPPNNHQHLRQYKHTGRRVLRKLAARTCLNLCVPCTIKF